MALTLFDSATYGRFYSLFRAFRSLLFISLLTSAVAAQQSFAQQSGPQTSPGTQQSAVVTADDVINFLNDSINWYRQTSAEAAIASQPGQKLIATANRRLADQYLRLAFQYARAQASLLGSSDNADQGTTQQGTSTRTRLQNSLAEVEARIAEIQKQLAAIDDQLENARGDARLRFTSRREILRSELALMQARRDSVSTFLGYVQSFDSRTGGKASLAARIDELERGIPELHAQTSVGSTASKIAAKDADDDSPSADSRLDGTKDRSVTDVSPQADAPLTSAPAVQKESSSGLASALGALIRIRRDIAAMDRDTRTTSALSDAQRKLVMPLVQQMNAAAAEGQALAKESDEADPQLAIANKDQIDTITKRFKQVSAATLPLGRAGLMLRSYRGNLADWRKQLEEEGRSRFYEVALRICLLGAVILVILALSNLWRRATVRYIADTRRQEQILLIRRIVVTAVLTLIIAFAVVSETGSLATYAGLVTAGLAVALQNIILSLIAYFFLIGRYGVHVGDRVTISGVTGEVLEIGLLRLHLTELGGDPTDLHTTGRVVVFSNAVILQPTAYLFKQAPMMNFVWHEMKVTCSIPNSCENIRDRIAEAIRPIYNAEIEGGKAKGWSGPQPVVRVLVGEAGPRILIRYPVNVRGASDLDERVNRAVLSVVQETTVAKM